VSEESPRTSGVALTRSVSVRTGVARPAANNHLLAAPTGNGSSSRRHAHLTSVQRLPFPAECPTAVTGGVLRRSTSCPLMAVDRVACPAADGCRQDRGDDDGHPTLLPVVALLPLTELFHSTS